MRFYLTNDDGVDAPGLSALKKAVPGDVMTIAPARAYSGCGHQVTTFGKSIRVEKRSADTWAVHGTPADCTRIALTQLPRDEVCVLSGINLGGNLGVDVYISGTVAAAREAAIFDVPAIAISQYLNRREPVDWARATHWSAMIIDELLSLERPARSFWNVNLPHLSAEDGEPEVVFCDVCPLPLPVNYEVDGENLRYTGVYQDRERAPGTDVDVCFLGDIAASLVRV